MARGVAGGLVDGWRWIALMGRALPFPIAVLPNRPLPIRLTLPTLDRGWILVPHVGYGSACPAPLRRVGL
jgi:hypothetical protein